MPSFIISLSGGLDAFQPNVTWVIPRVGHILYRVGEMSLHITFDASVLNEKYFKLLNVCISITLCIEMYKKIHHRGHFKPFGCLWALLYIGNTESVLTVETMLFGKFRLLYLLFSVSWVYPDVTNPLCKIIWLELFFYIYNFTIKTYMLRCFYTSNLIIDMLT